MDDKFTIGRYRHYTGRTYDVLDVVQDSETNEQHVVYMELDKKDVLICPLSVFTGLVPGHLLPRFEWIES